MSKKEQKEQKAKRVTVIGQVRDYYAKHVVPNIGTVPNNELRGPTLAFTVGIGATPASAASMFNVVQKENIAAGTVDVTKVGRGAQAAAKAAAEAAKADAKAAAEAAKAGPDLSLPWAVVNKKSREVVNTFPSRSKATKAKGKKETVVKTASL